MTNAEPNQGLQRQVIVEYLPEELREFVADPTQYPNQLLTRLAAEVLQISNDAGVVYSANFVRSVQDRFDARGVGIIYGTSRGANVAVAKTMRTADGGVDILIDIDALFIDPESTEEQLDGHHLLLFHLAAHEAIHALHHFRGEDSEAVYNSMNVRSSEQRYFATEAGTIIEEYRAELAAESLHPHPSPFSDVLSSDISAFVASTAEARTMVRTDLHAAARLQSAAFTNLWKALSLLAAEIRVRETALPASVESSSEWQNVAAPLWAEWCVLLGRLPDGQAEADLARLRSVTTDLIQLLKRSYVLARIDRSWDSQDRELMFWR
ncbi:hypothetical protein [Mycetocola zhadangensis]|uniref:Uncharacterized protein n=1 Tax=Mycetocola zhadangensis TaxID=1164595 RepID=A0A3L7JD55_9MICO|nr:hypothetical protein [Mycetocola zhadangensis]RLQ86422.1 hypothetical protein D9V28_06300 [Mycetocola zhadangensis]GGE91068.1 hypothetical protein GCM10011313_12440 [Mycetocola zhadangensis]